MPFFFFFFFFFGDGRTNLYCPLHLPPQLAIVVFCVLNVICFFYHCVSRRRAEDERLRELSERFQVNGTVGRVRDDGADIGGATNRNEVWI